MTAAAPYISVILPVFNEVDNLRPLQAELEAALDGWGRSYEIIYVDDGSEDGSLEALAQIAAQRPDVVRVEQLRRNFGQTAALAAGIDYARGQIIAPLDADLQNDPADIPRLAAKLEEGYDVVSGWRRERQDAYLTRLLPSRLANRLISVATGGGLHDYGCTLKVYRREIAANIHLYGEMHRFIPVFAAAAGAVVTEMPVNHRPRIHGRSKVGLERTGKVLLDLITVKFLSSFATRPMYIFGGSGLFLIGLSFVVVLAMLLNKWLRGVSLILTPLPTLAAMFFITGFQSILMGLMTELMVRTYHESQGKPIYVVRRVIEASPDETAD